MELEPIAELARAGFVDVTVTTLRDRTDHVVASIELREIVVEATKHARREEPRTPVVYLGPFARVTDDRGVTFERGVRTWIARSHAEALAAGTLTSSFALATRTIGGAASREDCCE